MCVSVVNARYIKQVPGRKTDVKDSQWLARLARYSLVKGSFIPSKDLRELRIIASHRTKLRGMLASEKNRLGSRSQSHGIAALSARERESLYYLSKGFTDKKIAKQLGAVYNWSTDHSRPTFRGLSTESMNPVDKPWGVGS